VYDIEQFKLTYFSECQELLDEMEEHLMQMDASAADDDVLNAVFRCAHSIKGGGGAFGLDDLVSFTHVQEALLEELRSHTLQLNQTIVDTLLQSVDCVRDILGEVQNGSSYNRDTVNAVRAQLQELSAGGGVANATPAGPVAATKASGTQTYSIRFLPKPELLASGNEPILLLRELSGLGEMQVSVDTSRLPAFDEVEPDICYLSWTLQLTTDAGEDAIREVFEFVDDACDLEITAQSAPAPEEDNSFGLFDEAIQAMKEQDAAEENKPSPGAAAVARPAAAAPPQSIRVDLDKVDSLVNMVGEMVIAQAMIMVQVNRLPVEEHMDLIRSAESLGQHMRDMQEAVMSVRMQPVKSIFSRMSRLVRDTSRDLGKKIVLQTIGETTEIDKTVIEKLSDPLTHMIRNSMDHGIEKPADRLEKGKPERGTITLAADQRGGRIIIEITDDGNGINRERVLAKAKEKGLVAQDASPAPEEIDQLVFHPGFSTAEQVTNLSGRGVGMDVVRKNIEHLGGTITLINHPGKGTHFTITLPLTLAILDGMVVRIGAEYYVLPIASIVQSLRPTEEMVHRVRNGSDVVNVRDEFIPLVYLYEVFNISGARTDATTGIVVLAESGHDKVGLVVDEIMHQQQVVVKSIEENTDPVDGIAGATILGDGRVSLILDVARLHLMTQTSHSATAARLH
jgi:two-component system chemotaxis sensor kinase CheA